MPCETAGPPLDDIRRWADADELTDNRRNHAAVRIVSLDQPLSGVPGRVTLVLTSKHRRMNAPTHTRRPSLRDGSSVDLRQSCAGRVGHLIDGREFQEPLNEQVAIGLGQPVSAVLHLTQEDRLRELFETVHPSAVTAAADSSDGVVASPRPVAGLFEFPQPDSVLAAYGAKRIPHPLEPRSVQRLGIGTSCDVQGRCPVRYR